MTDLSPEILKLFPDITSWLFGALVLLLVYIAKQALNKIDKVENAVVTGLDKVTEALNNHHLDFSKRLGKTDERVAILETITVKLKEDVNGIYPRISIVEQAAATNAARLEKIVHPVGKR